MMSWRGAGAASACSRRGSAAVLPQAFGGVGRRYGSTLAEREKQLRPLLWLLGYWGPEATRARSANAMFESCLQQSSSSAWQKAEIPLEFRPQQQLLMAHIWMIHRRLYEFEGLKEAKLLQEGVFDELWHDTTKRIRKAGISEISVDKNLGDVQKYSFAAAVEYDEALMDSDKEDAMAAAVWRHIYLTPDKDDATIERCTNVARYVIKQIDMLTSLSEQEVLEAKFKWTQPKFNIPKNKL